MKKALKLVLLGFVGLVLLVVIVAATRPSEFRISRETLINAPAETVFAQVNDFHAWSQWSPWEKMDPGMKRTYEGPATGLGARYSWEGNQQVGSGRMTIIESTPPHSVRIQLEFLQPFAATNEAQFQLNEPAPRQTTVAWVMTGHLTLVPKIFHLFMDMDKLVGADFEKGLAQLKAIAEASPGK